MSEDVNDRDNIRALSHTLLLRCGDKRPELVDVDSGAPEQVAGQMEVTHTNLTEVTRMVFIEVGSVLGAHFVRFGGKVGKSSYFQNHISCRRVQVMVFRQFFGTT